VITAEVYDVLARVRDAGTALLVVEQHVDHALALASRVVVCAHGQVVAGGPTEEVDLDTVFATAGVPDADGEVIR
jgi:branched-chain amino acid transport system ATP-binding protein